MTDNGRTGPGQSTEDVKWLDEKLRAFFEKDDLIGKLETTSL